MIQFEILFTAIMVGEWMHGQVIKGQLSVGWYHILGDLNWILRRICLLQSIKFETTSLKDVQNTEKMCLW